MTVSDAAATTPRQALEAEIMAAIRVAVEGAGPEGMPAAVLSEGILGVYGGRIDGPDLTMMLMHLALSQQLSYLPVDATEEHPDGWDHDVLVVPPEADPLYD